MRSCARRDSAVCRSWSITASFCWIHARSFPCDSTIAPGVVAMTAVFMAVSWSMHREGLLALVAGRSVVAGVLRCGERLLRELGEGRLQRVPQERVQLAAQLG